MSPQIISSALGLCRHFKASFRFFTNQLKLPAGVLCTINIINLDDSVSSSTAQIYKSFSLQLCETLIWLKYRSLWTKIHTPPFNQMQQSSPHCS